MKPLYQPAVISFRGRSPFETRHTPGLPPGHSLPPGISFVGDSPTIDGVPLPTSDVAPRDTQALAAPNASVTPIPDYNTALYSDATTFGVVFAGAGQAMVLPRPQSWRILLLIQNLSVLGNIFYTFDRNADNTSCIAIGAGGNRLWDSAVPQGDLHIFSTGAGTVTFEYMNRDISKLSYR